MSQQPPWSQGPTHPYGQQYPPAGQDPAWRYTPPAPGPTSVTGPRAMTLVGAALLVVAVVMLVLALPTLVSTVPLHVADRSGQAGSAAVATLEAPGTTEVQLQPGYYDVYLASVGTFAGLTGAVTVAGADGSAITVHDPTVTTSFTMMDTHVVAVASFHITTAGQYQVTADALAPQDATALLGQGKDPGTVAAAGLELAAAIIFGLAGLGLTIGGGIWWARRSGNRKRASAWQHAGGPALR